MVLGDRRRGDRRWRSHRGGVDREPRSRRVHRNDRDRAARPRSVRLLLGIVLFSISCGGSPAELVVVVRSDLQVPEQLSLVRAVVKDASGVPQSVNDFVLDGPSPPVLPFSFVIVPADGDSDRAIELCLGALDRDRNVLFERRARTGFLENRSLLLEMFLAAGCRDTTCA